MPISSKSTDAAPSLEERLGEKSVLVTGAAGSIGAELCHQIARLRPRRLIAFDQAETPLFLLEGAIRRVHPDVDFRCVIGNVTQSADVNEAMQTHKPSLVYHAAAYKHVSLMEGQIFAAVENNVFGTVEVARAACAHNVESFVLISTDKAVRPASVMGATKRIAELAVLSLKNQAQTRFVAVRFGNVMESGGSVIPIFRSQIANGGPVTVTDAGMMRYFMKVSEASELVLQASALGLGGEIFIFDMGEPVRILDLAAKLIRDAGFEADQEIKIEFTGARAGEKLIEELKLASEHSAATAHDRIRMLTSSEQFEAAGIESGLHRLRQALSARDGFCLLSTIKQMVPDYDAERQFSLLDREGTI